MCFQRRSTAETQDLNTAAHACFFTLPNVNDKNGTQLGRAIDCTLLCPGGGIRLPNLVLVKDWLEACASSLDGLACSSCFVTHGKFWNFGRYALDVIRCDETNIIIVFLPAVLITKIFLFIIIIIVIVLKAANCCVIWVLEKYKIVLKIIETINKNNNNILTIHLLLIENLRICWLLYIL